MSNFTDRNAIPEPPGDEYDAPHDLEPDDLEPELGLDPDDGRYCITFTVADGGLRVWIKPNDARYMAHQLTKIADEADAKNSARAVQQ